MTDQPTDLVQALRAARAARLGLADARRGGSPDLDAERTADVRVNQLLDRVDATAPAPPPEPTLNERLAAARRRGTVTVDPFAEEPADMNTALRRAAGRPAPDPEPPAAA